MVITQHPYAKATVTAQIALDLSRLRGNIENKENTCSVPQGAFSCASAIHLVLPHSSMFDAVIGHIKGELSSYLK